jgi:hypothetical protein
MKLNLLVVDWFGPYSEDDPSISANQWGNCLYAFTGKRKYDRRDDILYFGITEGNITSRLRRHHKIDEVTRNRKLWLGWFEQPGKWNRRHLELAEHCLVHYWKPWLNEKKVGKPPRDTVLISRWFYPFYAGEKERVRTNRPRVMNVIPDAIWWNGKSWQNACFRVSS